MPINVKNFINSLNLKSKNSDFQDLEHLDGVSISTICANLYSKSRDDLVMFYFRDGANYASVYTQSKIVSENIKWNLNIKSKKISSLIVNTRNANALAFLVLTIRELIFLLFIFKFHLIFSETIFDCV